MSVTIRQIASELERWAPPETAQSYDNTGLQLGRPEQSVETAVIGLDLTPALIAEAVRSNARLIITHHPLFFAPIKSITPDSMVGSMALTLAEQRIAHYAIHTNLDAAVGGVSFALAGQLGLTDLKFLEDESEDGATGIGAVGMLEESMSSQDFLRFVSRRLGLTSLRHVSDPDARISSVAVCGGSGSSFLPMALGADADAYVTGDVKYHQFFDALDPDGKPRIAFVDVGHYESEAVTEQILLDFLTTRFPGVNWIQTETTTSPVRSFVP